MELLRRRQFWLGLGAVVGALVAVGLYAIPPWPSPLNIFFDLVAFGAAYFASLAVISQFVLPVQTRRERRVVFDHFMHYVSGGTGPIIFIRDGKIVGRKDELRRYGHGVAVVDAVSAVVVERTSAPRNWFAPTNLDVNRGQHTPRPGSAGPALVRAAGPGIAFISPGERIVATLDLRRQARSAPVQGLTRDGIECGASLSVTFGLDPDPDRHGGEAVPPHERAERNLPAYPFSKASAFRAVYGVALGDKQPVDWTELPLNVAQECFRDVLSEYRLDDLFAPNRPDAFPFNDFAGRVNRAVKEAPVLRERGLVVYSVGVGDLRLPRAVTNQRVRSWQARWQKAAIQQEAAAETQAIRTESRWQAEAQQLIFKDIQQLIGATQDPVARRGLALMLVKALRRAAADPRTRQRLPEETLRTLDSLGEWHG